MTLISDRENKSLTDIFVLLAIYENVEFMLHGNLDGNLCSRSPKWDSSLGLILSRVLSACLFFNTFPFHVGE